MRARTITLVEFDSLERRTLARVEPSIRIAFPEAYDRAQRDREGRWLLGVCTTKQEWDAKAIWGAWDAAVTLEAVLDAQSAREYWERELTPPVTPRVLSEKVAPDEQGSVAVGLVAPGTDVCGMLAEARGAQLREVREALQILEQARDAVGPRPEPVESYEGV